jgi:hypothetical protein
MAPILWMICKNSSARLRSAETRRSDP